MFNVNCTYWLLKWRIVLWYNIVLVVAFRNTQVVQLLLICIWWQLWGLDRFVWSGVSWPQLELQILAWMVISGTNYSSFFPPSFVSCDWFFCVLHSFSDTWKRFLVEVFNFVRRLMLHSPCHYYYFGQHWSSISMARGFLGLPVRPLLNTNRRRWSRWTSFNVGGHSKHTSPMPCATIITCTTLFTIHGRRDRIPW
jgi:hypothetical protein